MKRETYGQRRLREQATALAAEADRLEAKADWNLIYQRLARQARADASAIAAYLAECEAERAAPNA